MAANEQTPLLNPEPLTPAQAHFSKNGQDQPQSKPRRPRQRLFLLLLLPLFATVILGTIWFSSERVKHKAPIAEPINAAPVRILIVGDSISQGWEGDFTWRYRLWEWAQANELQATFVGPYTGTHHAGPEHTSLDPLRTIPLTAEEAANLTIAAHTDGGYARAVAPAFLELGSSHAALWGQQAVQCAGRLGALVQAHRPDYLLLELGFNDLAWFAGGPESTVRVVKRLIDEARAVRPGLHFAVANVPQRRRLGGREDLPVNTDAYNALLQSAVPLWSFPTSLVELVKLREAYSCDVDECAGAYDGLHPNALGEFEIAAAFTQTLFDKFHMGRAPLEVPSYIPPRPCQVPRNPVAQRSRPGLEMRWDSVYGAYGYEVQARLEDVSWPGDEHVFFTQGQTFHAHWAGGGRRWYFRVRTQCGDTAKSGWSAVVSAAAVKDV